MSGPIVRKYGFPNFEKIFGERPLEHGAVEEANQPAAKQPADPTANQAAKPRSSSPADKKKDS